MDRTPIDELTDVDVKITDDIGLIKNTHSGVVELAFRTTEHKNSGCGCCTYMVEGVEYAKVVESDLLQLLSEYRKLF